MIINDRIEVIKGDITKLKVDAIINAANSSLMGGGGVDGAIHAKGGNEILNECMQIRQHQYPDGLPVGKAIITSSGKLPCNYVIHTVGPVWHGGRDGEQNILKDTYKNCLKLATETGLSTIAFPAISTGVYGFPKELSAPIVFKTVSEYLLNKSHPLKVFLVFYSDLDMQIFLDSINNKL